MSVRRFLVPPGSLAAGEVELPAEEAAHARRVLRLTAGDAVELLDGDGRRAAAVIRRLDARGGSCAVERVDMEPPPAPRLVVCPGLAKGPAMELMAVKLTELMCDALRPVICERSVPRLKDGAAKAARWQRLADQALKQCGATRAPVINAPEDLGKLLGRPPAGALKLMLHPHGDAPMLHQTLAGAGGASEVWALVGPEGGFTDDETGLAQEAGFALCRLPGAVLRAETACLALAALVRLAGLV